MHANTQYMYVLFKTKTNEYIMIYYIVLFFQYTMNICEIEIHDNFFINLHVL